MAEKVVRDQLLSRQIEPLLLLAHRVSQWKDRKKRVEWALFPEYCFARFAREQKLLVLHTQGVMEIVGGAGGPAPIPDEEISAVRRMMESGIPHWSWPYSTDGSLVKVIRGPLCGVHGCFVEQKNSSHLVLRVNLIRQAIAVEIDAADVCLVEYFATPGPQQYPDASVHPTFPPQSAY